MKVKTANDITIINEIKSIISQVARIDLFEINEDVKIREELGIDSLMAIEIVAKCEKFLNIEIDESKLDAIETINDFINYLLLLMKK